MHKTWRISAWIGGIYALLVLGITVYLGYNRPVVIAEASSGPGIRQETATNMTVVSEKAEISLQKDATGERSVYIPVEPSILPEQILIQDYYANKCLVISLQNTGKDFYKDKAISGNTDTIEKAVFVPGEEKTDIWLQLDRVYAYDSYLENGYLKMDFYLPKEKNDRILVLHVILPDEVTTEMAAEVTAEEETLLYQMENKLEAVLEESGIKAYHTYGKDGRISEEEIGELITLVDADLYVGISLSTDSDNSESFGSLVAYKGDYFMPALTNAAFADLIERKMVTAISGKAGGLLQAQESVWEDFQIPSVIVYPGYRSNPTEMSLMKQESYQRKIAEGIAEGIVDSYTKIEDAKGSPEG